MLVENLKHFLIGLSINKSVKCVLRKPN